MTVEELKRELDSMPQDAEVRLAMQPSWPFEYTISSVIEIVKEDDGSYGVSEVDEDDGPEIVVYLSEGRQIGYLPEAVIEELGW